MLQRIREWLILVLIGLLPFHAFLVTVGTRFIQGPGNAPMMGLVIWKEVLLGVILLIAMFEIMYSLRVTRHALRIDILDGLILGMLTLGIATSIAHDSSLITYIYGFKYTLFPLCVFLILRRVSWSKRFMFLVSRCVLLTGVIISGYGILSVILPQNFFTWLGYSDLHSLYIPDGALAAFQQIGGTAIRRIQSTFSGPNQLGVWLLLPWSLCVVSLVRKRMFHVPYSMFRVLLIGLALFFTFSRAAWIGAFVIVIVALLTRPYRHGRATNSKLLVRKKVVIAWLLGVSVVAVIGVFAFPDVVLRTASSRDHFQRPLEAIRVIADHPLGLGLGSAGPATNRTSDTCVFLEENADASWATVHPDLCVFTGNIQMQPETPCTCPFLPENWYLQVGVELGVLGFVAFITFIVLMIYQLLPTISYQLLAFIGMSIAALFLHAWESSAVAYTMWILLSLAVHRES